MDSPRYTFRWLISVLASLAALGAPAEESSRARVQDLKLGQEIEQGIAESERHLYRTSLPAGRSYLVRVEQIGIDLTLSVRDPDDRLLVVTNGPVVAWGQESLVFYAGSPGVYPIEATAGQPGGEAARYRIKVTPLAEETANERQRLAAELALSRAAELSIEDTAAARYQAIDEYQKALDLWRLLGEPRPQALAHYSIALLSGRLGEIPRALAEYQEALPLWRLSADRELVASTLNDLGLTYIDLGETDSARWFLERSVALSSELGNPYLEAITRGNLCLSSLSTGQVSAALPCFEQVRDLYRQIGDLHQEAGVLLNLGWIHSTLGHPQRSLENLQSGLDLLRTLEDRQGEAQALNNLGWAYEQLGELQTALDHYSQSLSLLQQIGDRWWMARLLNNIGYAYWRLGDLQRAQSFFRKALPVRREVRDRRGEAISLMNLGSIYLHQGESQRALEAYDQALVLTRETSHRQKEGVVLDLLGQTYMALDDSRAAKRLFDQALTIAREVGDRQAEAEILLHKGQLQIELLTPQLALPNLEQALQIHRATQAQQGEAQVLFELARAHRLLGQDHQAIADVEASLVLIESLRARVSSPNLRAAFLSSQHDAYELAIDLLMSRHFSATDKGYDRQAFAMSERARARSLLDLLTEADSEIYGRLDGATVQQREQLKRQLNAKAAYQLAVLGRQHTEQEAAAARLEVHQALAQLESLEATIRRDRPQIASLTRPQSLDVAETQKLLDPQTLLLEYALGKDRSFLWAIGHDSVAAFELPPRAQIEILAKRVYEQLRTVEVGQESVPSQDSYTLANLLLGQLDQELDHQRLVIVADGALHYLPFAALPTPRMAAAGQQDQADLLLTSHEIIHLSSASVLATQRRTLPFRAPASKTLAVLADPVFQHSDARLGTTSRPRPRTLASAEPGLERSGRRLGIQSFDRLPSSRLEAESIAALLPPEDVLLALDFSASRSTFFAEELSEYRIVHLATHGVINAEQPELSGLVFSQLDASGRNRNGFVRLHELYGLGLNAELVVLSGCQTALGAEILGEGWVGLTRGFMYSGARQVLASLWRVQDKATAKLMVHFYRAMLVDGLAPAAALRQAQLKIQRQRGGRAPYYWAAFVLQGDWLRGLK